MEVKDDGPGISPSDHDIIFHRYTQVKGNSSFERKGHGLGLVGALIQAKRLGGDITVRSHVGEGATFCLVLPFELE
jgi:signal transduction histidine kinase